MRRQNGTTTKDLGMLALRLTTGGLLMGHVAKNCLESLVGME
jgi:hypothetical protein